MRKTDAGFTLLELLTVLVIGGILLATGVPNMLELLRDNRISAQANEFLTTLSTARGEAIKRGVPVIVCRSPEGDVPACASGGTGGWAIGWAMFADVDNDGAFDPGEPVIQTRGPLTGSNQLVGNNNVANRVIFRPQGVVGAGGVGAFTLTDARPAPKGLRLICLAMTGRARVFSNGLTACPVE